ncbi:MAG: D-alanyl-D-alanine carboxypeptidase family protein [Rhodospirillaceae bacterium]
MVGFTENLRLRQYSIAGLALIVLFSLVITIVCPANAKYASIIMDARTGRVWHELNANTRNYPASLTKMMTLYLLFEKIDQGEMTLETRMRVSRRAARQPSSKIWMVPESTITTETAILALVVRSANDVAVVVAEHLGQTERKFARIMTARAKELGMARTNFRNASGLPNRAQLSTARDMAILAQRLINDFPNYYRYFSRTKFSYEGKTFHSHNKFIKQYQGADGLKTGYIKASGYNLAASAQRDKNRLIGVIFGGRSAKQRDSHLTKLMNKGFADTRENYTPYPERKPLVVIKVNEHQVSSNKSIDLLTKLEDELLTTKVWGIQIGAYLSNVVAEKKAEEAEKILKRTYETAFRHTELVVSSGKKLYRAQIRGLGESDTYSACTLITRIVEQCLIVSQELGYANSLAYNN